MDKFSFSSIDSICFCWASIWDVDTSISEHTRAISSVFCWTPASRFVMVSLSFSLFPVTPSSFCMHSFCSDSMALYFAVAASSSDFRSLFSADKLPVWPCNLTTPSFKPINLATVSSFSVSRQVMSALVFSRLDASSSFSDFRQDNTSSASLLPDKSCDTRSFAASRSVVSDSIDDSSLEISPHIVVRSEEVNSTFFESSFFSVVTADSWLVN
mmetsp:Transcript_43632/g.78306  ORF Transcript_43632/g.78306 Transcript_43632/m.78306 type:complete len:213 (+) Transcript_43632:973-1611(+)